MNTRNDRFKLDFMPIGQDIKRGREAKDVTREQLSEITGYAPRHIQAIENEGQTPSVDLLFQLAEMFDVSLDRHIFKDRDNVKSSMRRRVDTLLNGLSDKDLVNLDGVCEVPDYGPCIFEAKTASAFKAGEWEDSIPDAYQLQVQHYMAVTGYKAAYIAVLIGGNTFKWKCIERDDELISMLIQLESDFWQHVQDGTPPPLDGSAASAKFLAERFANSRPTSHIDLPSNAADLLRQYDEACEQLEAITEQKQLAENLLKELMGENEIGIAGNRIITWKSMSQERLDSKTLKAEHPALYKKYANKTSYRRFSIKAVA